MGILEELGRQSASLSQLARYRNINISEASRHLGRLDDANLVHKESEGQYRLTEFGSLVLSQLSGLEVVSKNADYFSNHDISRLPYEFIDRVGELTESEFIIHTFVNLNLIQNAIREAREYLWVISDRVPTFFFPLFAEKLKEGIEVRGIFPEGVLPPDNLAPFPSTTPRLQKRTLMNVDVVMLLTDVEVGFSLPSREGKFDYNGIHGNDPRSRKWNSDLFNYYWGMARPFTNK